MPVKKNGIQKLLDINQGRLQILKEKQAKQGSNTDPDLIMEIQDIEAEIKKLKQKLSKFSAWFIFE